MKNPLTGKTIVVAAITASLALGTATPAWAATASGEIIDGTINVSHPTTPLEFDLPGTGTDPCTTPAPDPTVEIDFTGTAVSGTAEVTDFQAVGRFQLEDDPMEPWYQINMSLYGPLTDAGTYQSRVATPPDYDISDVEVGIQATIYEIDPPSNCGTTDIVCQGIFVQLALDGTHVGSLPTPNAGDVSTMSGNSAGPVLGDIAISGACDPEFSGFNGEDVTVTNLQFEYD